MWIDCIFTDEHNIATYILIQNMLFHEEFQQVMLTLVALDDVFDMCSS